MKNLTTKKFIWMILTLIVAVALALRVWQLGSIPPSPNWDEVALGYNAYSILQTGKDEYGQSLPVVLRSFDDYKPALYAYLIVPFIPLFDLTAFTVRLPSAIFGTIGVIVAFFLVRVLFFEYKHRDKLALLVAFVLAISPISIQVSRIAFETNVGMVFNMLAALLFLLGLKRGWPLLFSAAFAALSIYTYQSEKVFTPILMIILLVIFWRDFWRIPKKYIVGSLAVGLIVIAPMVFYLATNSEALLRAQATSVLSDKTTFLSSNIERLENSIERGDRIGMLLNNRRFEYVKAFVGGYISHWDPNWLFITGDIKRHHAPEMGLLYHFEFPFMMIGIYLLLFGGFNTKTKLLIFSWFLLAPIPAAFTTGVPHALRTLNFIPTWQIFIAIGLIAAAIKVSSIKYQVLSIKVKYIFIGLFILFVGFNFSYYLNQYFSQQNYFYAADWQYGWEEAASYIKSVESEYDTVIVSSVEPLDQPHMFFAFYLKYPPQQYQGEAGKQFGGFGVNKAFGKYQFVPKIDWETHSALGNVLIVGRPYEIKDKYKIVKVINNFDGTPIMTIASIRNVD